MGDFAELACHGGDLGDRQHLLHAQQGEEVLADTGHVLDKLAANAAAERRRLANGAGFDFHDGVDGVDQGAHQVGFLVFVNLHDDDAGAYAEACVAVAKTLCQIDDRYDHTAQVDYAAHHAGHHRYQRDLVEFENFTHLAGGDAIQILVDPKCQVLALRLCLAVQFKMALHGSAPDAG